ncbi:hypothetical protein PFISCL1PPCAC_18467, partial [Pristionchus fissidentatus]
LPSASEEKTIDHEIIERPESSSFSTQSEPLMNDATRVLDYCIDGKSMGCRFGGGSVHYHLRRREEERF